MRLPSPDSALSAKLSALGRAALAAGHARVAILACDVSGDVTGALFALVVASVGAVGSSTEVSSDVTLTSPLPDGRLTLTQIDAAMSSLAAGALDRCPALGVLAALSRAGLNLRARAAASDAAAARAALPPPPVADDDSHSDDDDDEGGEDGGGRRGKDARAGGFDASALPPPLTLLDSVRFGRLYAAMALNRPLRGTGDALLPIAYDVGSSAERANGGGVGGGVTGVAAAAALAVKLAVSGGTDSALSAIAGGGKGLHAGSVFFPTSTGIGGDTFYSEYDEDAGDEDGAAAFPSPYSAEMQRAVALSQSPFVALLDGSVSALRAIVLALPPPSLLATQTPVDGYAQSTSLPASTRATNTSHASTASSPSSPSSSAALLDTRLVLSGGTVAPPPPPGLPTPLPAPAADSLQRWLGSVAPVAATPPGRGAAGSGSGGAAGGAGDEEEEEDGFGLGAAAGGLAGLGGHGATAAGECAIGVTLSFIKHGLGECCCTTFTTASY